MRKITLPMALATCSVGLALSPIAHAISFGMLKVHSYLEQPLDATLTYSNNPAEISGIIERNCIEIDRDKASESGLPVISKVQVQLEGNDISGVIRLRGNGPLSEPVAVIRLRSNCDSSNSVVREFTFFLDPQPEIRFKNGDDKPAAAASPIQLPRSVSVPKVKKQIDVPTKEIWTVKRGDTLTAIARHFQPAKEGQKELARAIMASNPDIKNANHIDIGQKLVIPELTALYAANAAPSSSDANAAASAPVVHRNKKQDQSDTSKADAPAVRYAKPAPADETVSYKVKLSPTQSGNVDNGKAGEDARKSQGKTNVVDADDKTAEMLALNSKIAQLEEQMLAMRVQLETKQAPLAATAKPDVKPAATKPAPVQPTAATSSNEGNGLPLWMLAPAGGVLLAGLVYLQRRRNS